MNNDPLDNCKQRLLPPFWGGHPCQFRESSTYFSVRNRPVSRAAEPSGGVFHWEKGSAKPPEEEPCSDRGKQRARHLRVFNPRKVLPMGIGIPALMKFIKFRVAGDHTRMMPSRYLELFPRVVFLSCADPSD